MDKKCCRKIKAIINTNNSSILELSRSFKLLGGQIEIVVYDIEEALADHLFEETYQEGLRVQKIFNMFDEQSELSILNKNRKGLVSKELMEVITTALPLCKMSKGKYDITLGKNTLARKKAQELQELQCSYNDIKTNKSKNRIRLNHKDIIIDLGSIAKGYIGDKLVEFLKKKGVISCLVDVRGDIKTIGTHKVPIGIQHPRNQTKLIEEFQLMNAGVATSGDYKQYQGSYENSHIINQKEIISITVVAKSLMIADGIATAFYVSDQSSRTKILKDYKEAKILTVNKDLQIRKYNWFKNNKKK